MIEEDQPTWSFLWREPDINRAPDVYQMRVLIFGDATSPSTANYVLRRIAEHNCEDPALSQETINAESKNFYMDDFLKVPMKWKIGVLKNRRIWKAFQSEEEWSFPFCHISSRSRDIQDFCIMQIKYWWRHKVWIWKSKHKVENISASNDAKQLEFGKHVVH